MGNYADGRGYLQYAACTEKQVLKITDILSDVFEVFDVLSLNADAASQVQMEVSHSGDYYEDTTLSALNEASDIAPLLDGSICFAGDDGSLWRLRYADGEWREEEAAITFSGDVAPVGSVIYVYKEYNDETAYGEELIQVFSNKQDACHSLKKRVREQYGMSLEELRQDVMFASDWLDDDHVAITNDGGDTRYFIVEEHTVQ